MMLKYLLLNADVYLAGLFGMLIFGMGLYGLFISNVPHEDLPYSGCSL